MTNKATAARQRSTTYRMDSWTAYLMILPSLVFLGIFVLAPLVMSLEKSFTCLLYTSPSPRDTR